MPPRSPTSNREAVVANVVAESGQTETTEAAAEVNDYSPQNINCTTTTSSSSIIKSSTPHTTNTYSPTTATQSSTGLHDQYMQYSSDLGNEWQQQRTGGGFANELRADEEGD